MSLTKKDFIKVAEILNKRYKGFKEVNEGFEMREQEFNDLTNDFVIWFKSENKDFNEEKFKEAVLN